MASFVTFYRLFTMSNILIYFLKYEGVQETGFGLDINNFLY